MRICAIHSKLPIWPKVLLSVPMTFSEPGALHLMEGFQNHCHLVTVTQWLLTVISETSIFGNRILLCWLNTHMQVQKEKHELKILHFSLNMRKIRKKEPVLQWEKTYWRLHKNNPNTTAAELCSLQSGLGKGMASFQRKLELNSLADVRSHCVWPRSEPRSLNHWVKWYKCLCLRLQYDEGGFANSPLLL